MILRSEDRVSRRLAEIGTEFGHGLALDLSRIRAVLAALNNPERRLPPVFHVAGTNGKGSVCAFLRALCEAMGLKAHVFTSPHLIRPNERIRLAGRLIGDDAFLAALDRVAATGLQVTYFEAITAGAFLAFSEEPADVAIVEVGLGGRLDATNVFERPAAACIAPVAFDHMHLLGDTLPLIAAEKAGILRRDAPAVIGRQSPEAAETIEAIAERVGARLFRFGVEWDAREAGGRLVVETQDRLFDLPAPSLPGAHQFENAGHAVAALAAAGVPLEDDALARGVTRAVWPARMQRLTTGALVEAAAGAELWLDGAHNPHGAEALARALAAMNARAPAPAALVFGVLARKDAKGALAALRSAADLLVAAPFSNGDAASPDAVRDQAAAIGFEAHAADSLEAAVRFARERAGPKARIVICGSLYLAGEALAVSGGVD